MFTPIIDLEVLNKSTILHFTDVTGPDVGDGTKWNGPSGLSTQNVSQATITVTDPNNLVTSIDVTSNITSAWPTTGNISFTNIAGEWTDGYYSVEYKIWINVKGILDITDYPQIPGVIRIHSLAHNVKDGMKVTITGTTMYDGFYDASRLNDDYFTIYKQFIGTSTGVVIPCYYTKFTPFVFSNIEMGINKMLATYCNIDDNIIADEYMKQVRDLNGLLLALRSSLITTTADKVNNIYGRITRILDYNKIELTY